MNIRGRRPFSSLVRHDFSRFFEPHVLARALFNRSVSHNSYVVGCSKVIRLFSRRVFPNLEKFSNFFRGEDLCTVKRP